MQLDIPVKLTSNNNHLPSHKKILLKKRKKEKKKKIQKYGGLDQNPYINSGSIIFYQQGEIYK